MPSEPKSPTMVKKMKKGEKMFEHTIKQTEHMKETNIHYDETALRAGSIKSNSSKSSHIIYTVPSPGLAGSFIKTG